MNAGDVLCEIQTDKAVVALEADEDGRLAKIVMDKDAGTLKVGQLIAVMAEDGEDIAEAVKALTTKMSSPREADLQELKRLVRYIRYRPRAELRVFKQSLGSAVFLDVFVDSDWGTPGGVPRASLQCLVAIA